MPEHDVAPVIRLEGVGVKFQLPVEKISSFKEYCLRRLTGGLITRELWALKNIDLCVESGEMVGIVGRNGAGKSTLLRVIARALSPTTGRLRLRGRFVPLLGVGAGFQADLTGRENVFINAALFGHDRATTQRYLDEIIAFSELEEYIHLPIRQFSSGMVARLGFAVGTMIRPDVLILDEVLAVGDELFQEKCFNRIDAFSARGTAVLLASHSAAAISHCHRAVWLRRGEVAAEGPPGAVLSRYRSFLASFPPAAEAPAPAAPSLSEPTLPQAAPPRARRFADGADSLIGELHRRCGDPNSVFCAFRLYSEARQAAYRHGFDLARVLELGPGSQPGALLCFRAGGSERAATTGVPDAQPGADDLELLKGYLACVGGFGWWRYTADLYRGDELRSPICWNEAELEPLAASIETVPPTPYQRLPFANDSFSFAYSFGSLEHVPNPELVIDELWRVLRPGSGTVHEINLCHLGFAEPLADLRYTEEEYRELAQQRSEDFMLVEVPAEVPVAQAYCNRWRTSDFVAAFEEASFEVLDVEPVILLEESKIDRGRMAEPFRSKTVEDLATVVVRITAVSKKRGG